MRPNLRRTVLLATAACCLLPIGVVATAAFAEEQPGVLRTDVPKPLAERMLKEGNDREACKKSICEVSRSKKADGPALACKVVKTWPSIDLTEKVFKGKMEWKWGNAQCDAEIKLDRALVARIFAEPKVEGKIGKHKVSCNLEQDDGKESHKISFSIDPSVTFENGKATKAVLGWADVEGSTLVKSALWSATAVDNTFNVLQGTVVEQINEFFGAKCDEALK
jgi:hypothetical protein